MKSKSLHRDVAVVTILFSALLVPKAHADVASIIALLSTITGTLKNGVGLVLNGIQTIENTERQLQQQIVWPLQAINQARGFVGQVRSRWTNLADQIHSVALNSASLANPRRLESLVRSRQASDSSQIGASFTQIYEPLPQAAEASPVQRNLMDMDDALAMGSLKSSVISDQASEQILTVADNIEQQTASSSPGSAPLLGAQAQVASLESQALLQRMLAAQLRQEAGRLAHSNFLIKQSAAATRNLTNQMQQILSTH